MKKKRSKRADLAKREEILRKRRKRKRRRILVLVIEVIILAALSVVAYGIFKLGSLNHLSLNVDNNGWTQEGYTNIALFGTDSREGAAENGEPVRSDTIIVASLNNETKEVKLVSVYRDTMLEQEGQHYDKANVAYAQGGPEEAVNMLNRNLDLDIEDYVSVNFLAMADVVDALDGVDIELTDEEVVHMNNYCVETSEVTGKSYERIEPEVGGTYHLNGVQAVSYARIRYTAGGDFTRTERQRLLIEKVVEKAKDAGIVKINEIIDAVLPEVSTSLSASEILQMAVGVFDYTLGDSKGFPFDSATPESVPGYSGSYVVPVGLENNVIQLHEFLFPDEEYTPTEKLTSISDNIAYITGIYPEVTSDSTTQESGSESTEDNGYGY
ncbi:MAG: LCP family protein [Lachnospiraceae bacterium]|nr:LCP family protein [Lachnospiraceae bacterium]